MSHHNNLINIITLSSGVDLESGVQTITEKVTQTVKGVTPIIFGLMTAIALVFTLFKGVQALLAHRQGHPNSPVPVIVGAIATVICGMFTTSAFFGWFGL